MQPVVSGECLYSPSIIRWIDRIMQEIRTISFELKEN